MGAESKISNASKKRITKIINKNRQAMKEKQDLQVVKTEETKSPSPQTLIELAIAKGTDISQLEALMNLQERWEAKEAAKAFKQSMADFQKEKPEIKKDKKASFKLKSGGTTSYNFVTLSSIQKLVDPILSKYGLSYLWKQEQSDNHITITCELSHIMGHVEANKISAPHDSSGSKNQIQAIGSTISYLKRYSLEGALGLSSDVDDDANSGNKNRKPEMKPGSEAWSNVVKHLKAGGHTIEQVESKYYLNPENRAKLLESAI